MLEYRVLGGFAVHGAGGDMSVGGPQQRRLLAVLLVHRNGVVSVDDRSVRVWDWRAGTAVGGFDTSAP